MTDMVPFQVGERYIRKSYKLAQLKKSKQHGQFSEYCHCISEDIHLVIDNALNSKIIYAPKKLTLTRWAPMTNRLKQTGTKFWSSVS